MDTTMLASPVFRSALTTQETTMVRKTLALGLLAMSLAAAGANAQTAPAGTAQPKAPPGAAQPAANPVDPKAIQALKDMGTYLMTLKRFGVSTELTGERVLADGQKLQTTATADLDVDRPNKVRVLMKSARNERQLTYDGKTVSLYTPAQKVYGTLAFDGSLGALIDLMEGKYGMQIPLDDLFRFGTPEAPLDKFESAMYAGQDFVDDDLCNHYAFRRDKIDWQIWIMTGSKPLPRKIVITNRADEARPQSVQFLDWNLKPAFKDAVFKFTPPKDSKKIEIVPVKIK
jgi:hypothetical protein